MNASQRIIAELQAQLDTRDAKIRKLKRAAELLYDITYAQRNAFYLRSEQRRDAGFGIMVDGDRYARRYQQLQRRLETVRKYVKEA